MPLNYAKVSIKVLIFFGQGFIDLALGVPEILREAKCPPHPPPLWINGPKKPMMYRVKTRNFAKGKYICEKKMTH